MRYICLIAVLLALPLTASAQQRRSADRGADQNRSEQRQSNARQGDRRSDDGRSDERRSDGRRSGERRSADKPPVHAAQLPWWEQKQQPWWEQKQTPAWELNRIPGYTQGNVARAMLDQQRGHAPVSRHRRQRSYQPTVVYVLPAYRYFQESIITTAQYGGTPAPAVTVHSDPPEPPLPPMGALRLEVEPKESLQVYVDGVYVGTPADLGDEIELTPGTRRIELRAERQRPQIRPVDLVPAIRRPVAPEPQVKHDAIERRHVDDPAAILNLHGM